MTNGAFCWTITVQPHLLCLPLENGGAENARVENPEVENMVPECRGSLYVRTIINTGLDL